MTDSERQLVQAMVNHTSFMKKYDDGIKRAVEAKAQLEIKGIQHILDTNPTDVRSIQMYLDNLKQTFG